jgi:hypothetical protein
VSEKLTAQEIVDAAQRDVNTTGGVMLDVCNEWKNENAQLREQVARLEKELRKKKWDNCECCGNLAYANTVQIGKWKRREARLKKENEGLAGAAHILHCHSFGGMVSDEELSDAREVALKYGKTAQQITEGK